MQEALWCLTARAAVRLGERGIAARAEAALRDARAEHAGAVSGMLTLGPVARYLAEAEACMQGPPGAAARDAPHGGRGRGPNQVSEAPCRGPTP